MVQQILNKKQILRSSQLSETAKLCSHLRTCYTNIDGITAHFPTPTKDSPVWDISVTQTTKRDTIHGEYSAIIDITEDLFLEIKALDSCQSRQLSPEMLSYYAVALLWARILPVKQRQAFILTQTGIKNLSFTNKGMSVGLTFLGTTV